MRSISKKFFVTCAVALVMALGCSRTASNGYPERNIEIIIPFNAGGGFDAYIRALAPHIEKHLPNKVNILPVNRPGAGGRRGALDVYRARPDGYTIGMFNLPGVLIPELQGEDVEYDLSRFSWLATLSTDGYGFIVKGNSPLGSIEEAKNLGRPVVYGATGPASTSHSATVIANEVLGIPYRIVSGYAGSSDYIVGVIRGDVDAAFANLSTIRPYIHSGDVKVLGIIGASGNDDSPGNAARLGPAALDNISLVRMLGGPPGLPQDVKSILENAILAALADPEFKAWLKSTGNEVTAAGADATTQSLTVMSEFYKNYKEFFK